MTAGSCALFAGAVCLQSETSGGSGEAPALCFHGSFYISPGCTENDTVWDLAFFLQSTRNTLMWLKSTIENKMTSCCVSHKNTFGSCQKKKKKKRAANRVGGFQLLYHVWLWLPALSSHLLGFSPCRQRKQHPGGLSAWMINSEGTFLSRGPLLRWYRQCVLSVPLKFKWCLPLCVPLTALKVLIKGEQQRWDRHKLEENRKAKSTSSPK